MEEDEGYAYMKNAGLPQIIEDILARVTEEQPADIHQFIGLNAFKVKVRAIVRKGGGGWPEGGDVDERLLRDLDFNPYDYEEDQLLLFIEHIMATASRDLGIDQSTLQTFILVIAANYDPQVPFHNLRHAVAVCQFSYALLHLTNVASKLNALERLALYVSCFCHDVGHLGLSNSYLVNSGHPLAVRYNDKSVMENHHCCCTFDALGVPECNILSNLQAEDKKRFRQIVVDLILSTDVSEHKKGYLAMKERAGQIDFTSPEDRLLVLRNFMMMSDLNNEARSFTNSQAWAPLVIEEFFRQGDRERAQNLPSLPCMDRTTAKTSSEQQFFIKHLCLPLYEANKAAFPSLGICVTNLQQNAESWSQM
eukprot:TRINITY_DN9236_c0_g1_i1.p1 TRINITY_DN9236_c0_g1~~TRINITY_DN9236_c0_g1_i1.p1  ORF type:complete len:365 (+),score=92.34 TRINITY_DN9236_c0_g1_i1:326-1420(+)